MPDEDSQLATGRRALLDLECFQIMLVELLLKTIDGQKERVPWVEDFKDPSGGQFSDMGQLDRRCSLGVQGGFQPA